MAKTEKSLRFWMVWCPDRQPPTYQHSTREDAQAEAERLARQNPGHEYHVLEAVGGALARNPKIRRLRPSRDAEQIIPF